MYFPLMHQSYSFDRILENIIFLTDRKTLNIPTFSEGDGKKEIPTQLYGSTMLYIFLYTYFPKEAEFIQEFLYCSISTPRKKEIE